MKLGNAIAAVATPIARAFRMGCINPATQQLRPESECAQMRSNLNQGMSLAEAVIARWFSKQNQDGETKMKQSYVVTEQHVVMEADSLRDALAKHLAGGSESISINAQVVTAPQRPPATSTAPAKKT